MLSKVISVKLPGNIAVSLGLNGKSNSCFDGFDFESLDRGKDHFLKERVFIYLCFFSSVMLNMSESLSHCFLVKS